VPRDYFFQNPANGLFGVRVLFVTSEAFPFAKTVVPASMMRSLQWCELDVFC
jgi:hypothetical protein